MFDICLIYVAKDKELRRFAKLFKRVFKYRKILNVSPGLIEVFKHFFGGLYSGGLIFGGHFVLVSEYQDLKNHCFI